MRRNFSLAILSALSAFAAVSSISSASAAEAIQDRYCLQGRISGYPGNCEFSTYQQCIASASGTADGCGLNPMRAYAQQPRRHYRGQ